MPSVHSKELTYRDLCYHFFSSIFQTKPGRLLIAIWFFGSGSSIILGAIQKVYLKHQKNKAEVAKNKLTKDAEASKKMKQTLLDQLKPILKISFPSLYDKSTFYFTLYTLFLIIRIWLTIKVPFFFFDLTLKLIQT